jgi:hypothetical protein
MKFNLAGRIEKISELVKKEEGFSKAFFEQADSHLRALSKLFGISKIQAALFVVILDCCSLASCTIDEITKTLNCASIQLIRFMNDIEELKKRKLIHYRGTEVFSEKDKNVFHIPKNIITCIMKNEAPPVEDFRNIPISKFFLCLAFLFTERSYNDSYVDFFSALKDIFKINPELLFTQRITQLHLSDENFILLTFFCNLYINNDDDSVCFHDLNGLFENHLQLIHVRQSLSNGSNELMELDMVENTNNQGFGSKESFKLSDKAKTELLSELDIKVQKPKPKKGLVLSDSLPEKQLYYNAKEQAQVDQLASLLREPAFSGVCRRLSESGMRTGFACLFSGPPGTGKTETVYQIARSTRRDIMQVHIEETKSMWFGESEKKIKALFDHYRKMVKYSESEGALSPILLFNEADAVISKRRGIGDVNGAIDEVENRIQNIILQEFENLKGILIATTNLTMNMDKAFERRFLYKIVFSKPLPEARRSIWQSCIPGLSDSDASYLAEHYDFSGGQIENIARKRIISSVISGSEISLKEMIVLCGEEITAAASVRSIGFTE